MEIARTGRLLSGIGAVTLALSTAAKAQSVDIGEVVITPNRSATERARTGSTVQTIKSEEIAAQSKPEITDYLTELPGVSVSAPGTPGQETSLSIRGADKKYIKTLFNGIDISDPSATQVQTSYEHLITGGVSKIEVVKGSQSTLYGSDAIAGVIGLSTLDDIELGTDAETRLEAGSFTTARGGFGVKGSTPELRAALNADYFRTGGISVADERDGNKEEDAYHNVSVNLAGEFDVSDQVTLFASALTIRNESEFDDSGPVTDNKSNVTDSNQQAGRVGARIALFEGKWTNTVSVQQFDIDRDLNLRNQFGPFDANYHGQRTKADIQSDLEIRSWLTAQLGADHERQQAEVEDNFGTDTNDDMHISGLWGQFIVSPFEELTLTAGVRQDDHNEFGGHTSYRFTGSYELTATGTRFHSSYGTGYRAPSLFELFAPFNGNEDLDPEKSRSFDAGIEQVLLEGRLVGDVTFFLLDTEDLIDFDFDSGTFQQVDGTTKRRGIETSLFWFPANWIEAVGAYTYTDTEQEDGNRRPRVPRHEVNLRTSIYPKEDWRITVTARGVYDVTDRLATGDVMLDDYVLFDANVTFSPTDQLDLYVRASNLLDQNYQVVNGYGTPGLSAFAGLRLRL